MHTIFIIEDERKIADSIASFLAAYDYRTILVQDFTRVLDEFSECDPQLVILDVNLPYQDGYHLCRQIRKQSHVPILFLSAQAGDLAQIYGMESGGDDYVTKPFQLDLLLAKVKALLRRAYGDYRAEFATDPKIDINNLVLDPTRMQLTFQGDVQTLTKNELKLLQLLMSQSGKVVTREACLEVLWDDLTFVDDNTLTVNVTRVRKKLAHWQLADWIETKRGVGYCFQPQSPGVPS